MIEFLSDGGLQGEIVKAIAFVALCSLFQCKTSIILAAAAIINVFNGYFEPSYTVVYSARLDLITLLAVFMFGDKHIRYQCFLLLACLVFHRKFELDQLNDTNFVFSQYSIIILTITIMQMLGAVYGARDRINRVMGVVERAWRSYSDVYLPGHWRYNCHSLGLFKGKGK